MKGHDGDGETWYQYASASTRSPALPDGHLPSALRNEPDAVFVDHNTIPFQQWPTLLLAGEPKIHR